MKLGIMILLLAGQSALACVGKCGPAGNGPQVVFENGQRLVIFKDSLMREIDRVLHSAKSTSEKISVIKALFYVNAVSIGNGASYCDVAAQTYTDRRYPQKRLLEACQAIFQDDNLAKDLVTDGPEYRSLLELNLIVSKLIKIYMFL